jgi:hypothetical protein
MSRARDARPGTEDVVRRRFGRRREGARRFQAGPSWIAQAGAHRRAASRGKTSSRLTLEGVSRWPSPCPARRQRAVLGFAERRGTPVRRWRWPNRAASSGLTGTAVARRRARSHAGRRRLACASGHGCAGRALGARRDPGAVEPRLGIGLAVAEQIAVAELRRRLFLARAGGASGRCRTVGRAAWTPGLAVHSRRVASIEAGEWPAPAGDAPTGSALSRARHAGHRWIDSRAFA